MKSAIPPQTDKTQETPSLAPKVWPAWALLLAGLAVTAAATLMVKAGVDASALRELKFTANDVQLSIQSRMKAHEQILRGGAGLFSASPSVDRHAWHAYTQALAAHQELPGIQGIGFALLIPPAQLKEHIAETRRQGFPDYTVKPAGERGIYSSIIYLEPFDWRNRRAFGYDMLSEPVRRAAMERARDENNATLTGKIKLVQETQQDIQAGVLMYVPVYRNGLPIATVEQRQAALLGWVYSPYRMEDLMSGILGQSSGKESQAARLQIYDGDRISAESLLYDSEAGKPMVKGATHAHALQQILVFKVGGATWTLRYSEADIPLTANIYANVWGAMAAGAAISLLLFALFLATLNTRRNAQLIAARLTAELAKSEQRYRTVADYTYDWEYWEGPQQELLYMSPSCERITGYSLAEFMADPDLLYRIIHPDDRHLMADHHNDASLQDEGNIDFRIVNRDGEVRWIAHGCRLVYGSDGSLMGRRANNRDITERKLAEQELKRSNAELEQFSYAISHDMRQPLRMISSYLQLLEKRLAGQLDGDKREFFNFAIDGAKRLDRMLLALLEYSRVGRKGEPPDWVESRALLDEALHFLQPAIAEAQAEVKIAGDWPRVFVSRDEMMRLIQNLVGNAVKYRVAGRKPEITVSSATVDNEWRLSVADNGVGILPDQIHRLFQVFQRLQTQSAYEGTGIGLALCRKIAEHHGGSVSASSQGEGQGSTFWVKLPLAAPDAPKISATSLEVKDTTDSPAANQTGMAVGQEKP